VVKAVLNLSATYHSHFRCMSMSFSELPTQYREVVENYGGTLTIYKPILEEQTTEPPSRERC